MPSGNDTVQLMIDILGQEGIDRLVKSTANYKALLEDLADKLKAGDISADEFAKSSARLSAELEREERLLGKINKAREAEEAAEKIALETAEIARQTAEREQAARAAERQAAQLAALHGLMRAETTIVSANTSAIKKESDTYDVLERQVGEYEVMERRTTETIRVQTTMLDQLGISLHKNTGLYEVAATEAARMGQVAGRQGDFGRGMLQASFAVQDFTSVLGTQGLGRALSSVQNNIPILVTALGAGAGLAGAISIVSVGVGLLIDNWGKLTGAWDDEETKKEAERQKDLAKATEATAAAAERLARAQGRTVREGQTGFDKAVKEFGGEAVLQELQKALVAKSGSFGAEADRKFAKNLFANLMQGNRGAHALLGDLDLRGDIGAVLRGEATPEEIHATNAKRMEREAKERDEARAKAKEERKKKADETRKLEEQFEEGSKEIGYAEREEAREAREKAAARRARNAMDMARRVGRATKEGAAGVGEPGGHLPLMPLNATPQEQLEIMLRTNEVMLKNQEKESVQIQRFREQLRRAQQIEARLENPPMPTGLPR